MASARYQLPQHPTLAGPYTKDELYLLVDRGSIARGEIVTDRVNGRSHKVGELIDGMKPPRPKELGERVDRPAYQEFSGDAPWEERPRVITHPVNGDEDDFDPENDDFLLDDTTGVSDDDICYHGHPSWLAFMSPMFFVLLLLGGSVWMLQFSMNYFFIGLGVTSFVFCCILITRQQRDYFVSGERVETEWGIVGRSSREVRIADIRSIEVHHTGIKGWFGVGTVDFSSAGGNEVEVQFVNIRKPHRIKELVRQLQRRAGMEV